MASNLIWFVTLYLGVSIAIGLVAAMVLGSVLPQWYGSRTPAVAAER